MALLDLPRHYVWPPPTVRHHNGGDPLTAASVVVHPTRDVLEDDGSFEVTVDYLTDVGGRISRNAPDAYNPPVVRYPEDHVAVAAEHLQVRVREGRDILYQLSLLLLGSVGEYLFKFAVGRLVEGFGHQATDLCSMLLDVQFPTSPDLGCCTVDALSPRFWCRGLLIFLQMQEN
jgi:hypothetical protein